MNKTNAVEVSNHAVSPEFSSSANKGEAAPRINNRPVAFRTADGNPEDSRSLVPKQARKERLDFGVGFRGGQSLRVAAAVAPGWATAPRGVCGCSQLSFGVKKLTRPSHRTRYGVSFLQTFPVGDGDGEDMARWVAMFASCVRCFGLHFDELKRVQEDTCPVIP